MDLGKKTNRIKMGLLRQKSIEQSTEKTPLLLQQEQEFHESFENERKVNVNTVDAANGSRTNELENSAINSENNKNQNIVTLHRGLLRSQWSSSMSLSQTLSVDGSKDTQSSGPDCSDVTKGFLLAIAGAGVMYGLTGVFVRLAGDNGVGSIETLFVRSVVQSIFFGSLGAIKKIPLYPPAGRVWYCVLIAVMYSLATIASFEAFNVIPPGNAIAIRGASRSIFSVILSFLLIREKIQIKDFFSMFICVGGIALMIASSLLPSNNDYVVPQGLPNNRIIINVYGYLLIVFAGVTRSVGMSTVRYLRGELHAFTVVTYHSMLTLIVTFALLFVRQLPWPPTAAGIAYTIAVCITSSVATWSSNCAVQLINPGLVSLCQNADLVVSMILEHTILFVAPSILEILGASLIFLGVSSLAWLKWRASKQDNK